MSEQCPKCGSKVTYRGSRCSLLIHDRKQIIEWACGCAVTADGKPYTTETDRCRRIQIKVLARALELADEAAGEQWSAGLIDRARKELEGKI